MNYWCFFDINELVVLWVECDDVFEVVYVLLLWLVCEGWVDGLCIDYVDGLFFLGVYLWCFCELFDVVCVVGGCDL